MEAWLEEREARVKSEMNIAETIPQNLIDDKAAATMLGVSPPTLRSWRCRCIGPAFIKLGHGKKAAVRYDLRDLAQFIEIGRHVSHSSVRAAFERSKRGGVQTPRFQVLARGLHGERTTSP